MGVEYTSPGSTRHFYGPRLSPSTKPDPAGSSESTAGNIRELEFRFDYENLPAYSAASASDAVKLAIPAHSAIVSAVLMVEQTWVGGTSLEVGTVSTAGVAVDADGLIPAAVGVTANLVAGYVISGRGAQVVEAPDAPGTAHIDADGVYAAGANGPIASVNSLVSVVAVGTYTQGRARLIVRYIPAAG